LITAVIDGDDLRDRRRLPMVSDADSELVVAKFARQTRRPSPP
jgi:hypothetical protein